MAVGVTSFPGAVDTSTELYALVNNWVGAVGTGGAAIGATTVPIVSTAGLPTSGKVTITTNGAPQIVTYTGTTGTSLTGVTALTASVNAGDPVELRPLAEHHNVLRDAIVAIETLTSGQWYSVKAFGAVGDGATNDAAAIQSAINAAATAGGGVVFFPRGIYVVGSTLTISGKPVSLIGSGTADANLDSLASLAAGNVGTLLRWSGGAAAMLTLTQVSGARFSNFAMDGMATATFGIDVDRMTRCALDHLRIVRDVTNGMRLRTTSATADDNVDWNTFTNIQLERSPTPLLLDGNAGHTANVCHNDFTNLFIDYTGDPGISLGDCDNNRFFGTFAYDRSGVGSPGVRFLPYASSNSFYGFEGTAHASTPNTAGVGNAIFYYDRSNGQAAPILDAGARLTWTEDGQNATGWTIDRNLGIGTVPAWRMHVHSSGFNHIKLTDPSRPSLYANIYLDGPNGRLLIEKPTGSPPSNNSWVEIGDIGGLDTINPFYSGFALRGHSVTKVGVAQFPKATTFSRSTLAADPTDYEFLYSADIGGLAGFVSFAAPNVAGSAVRFGFGAGSMSLEGLRIDYNAGAPSLKTNVGVIVAEQFVDNNVDVTLSSVTTAQSPFAAANDALTVVAATAYEFEALYLLGSGITSSTLSVLFGGTATLTSIAYTSMASGAAAGTAAAISGNEGTSAAAVVVLAALAVAARRVYLRGTIRVNAAGTLIPQIQFGTAPGVTVLGKAGSFFRLWPVGSNTIVAQGPWA